LRVRRPPGSARLRRLSGTPHGRRRANCFLGNSAMAQPGPVTLAFPCGLVACALAVSPRRKTLWPPSRISPRHFQ
jgi:hypothetical protein